MQNSKNIPFQEVQGGEYDPYGFYYTPSGSFWDPDGISFNAEGYDAHGGFYDEKLEYVPGPGWISELLCYEDEKDSVLNSIKSPNQQRPLGLLAEADEDDFDEEGDIDGIYEEIDYDKLMLEEEKTVNSSSNYTNNDPERLSAGEDSKVQGAKARKVYNPREVAQAHFNNVKNFANDVNNLNVKYEGNKNNFNNYNNSGASNYENEKKALEEEKEKPVITADMLFNKIPENLKPKNIAAEDKSKNIEQVKEGVIKIETKIEVDSLFG